MPRNPTAPLLWVTAARHAVVRRPPSPLHRRHHHSTRHPGGLLSATVRRHSTVRSPPSQSRRLRRLVNRLERVAVQQPVREGATNQLAARGEESEPREEQGPDEVEHGWGAWSGPCRTSMISQNTTFSGGSRSTGGSSVATAALGQIRRSEIQRVSAVVEGEFERAEDELRHGSMVSLTGGRATTGGRLSRVSGLLGSTATALDEIRRFHYPVLNGRRMTCAATRDLRATTNGRA
jgi:hypothetical protein